MADDRGTSYRSRGEDLLNAWRRAESFDVAPVAQLFAGPYVGERKRDPAAASKLCREGRRTANLRSSERVAGCRTAGTRPARHTVASCVCGVLPITSLASEELLGSAREEKRGSFEQNAEHQISIWTGPGLAAFSPVRTMTRVRVTLTLRLQLELLFHSHSNRRERSRCDSSSAVDQRSSSR